jgi:hypothetical protein
VRRGRKAAGLVLQDGQVATKGFDGNSGDGGLLSNLKVTEIKYIWRT